jgi:hypothetical protein
MILGSSLEFERHQNPEIVEREADNYELPQVKLDLKKSVKIRETILNWDF